MHTRGIGEMFVAQVCRKKPGKNLPSKNWREKTSDVDYVYISSLRVVQINYPLFRNVSFLSNQVFTTAIQARLTCVVSMTLCKEI